MIGRRSRLSRDQWLNRVCYYIGRMFTFMGAAIFIASRRALVCMRDGGFPTLSGEMFTKIETHVVLLFRSDSHRGCAYYPFFWAG